MEQQVQKIEGISPDMLWTFFVVGVGLMALVVLGYKVVEIFRKEHQYRQDKQQLNGKDVTDKIADKVIEKLTPQIDEKFKGFEKHFEEIDKKLAADKETIELHTSQLNATQSRVDRLDNDSKALCHGVFALLSHEVSNDKNGTDKEKLIKAESAMKNYLIDRVYKEENWQ